MHALSSGATVVTMPRFDLEEMLRRIEQHRISQILVPPPVVGALAAHPLVDRFDLSSLEIVACGGAPASAELECAVEARLGCLVAQGYGMTEAGPMIACSGVRPPGRGRGRAARGVHRGARGDRVDALRASVDEQAAPYKRLREIEVIEALPRSPTGKLLRRELVA